MFISKTSTLVHSFAAKDKARPEITGVLLTPDGTMAATDSYSLAEIKMKSMPKDDDFPLVAGHEQPVPLTSPVIIPAKFVASLGQSIPINAGLPILEYAALAKADENFVQFVTTDLETSQDHLTRKIDGQFPDYEKVLPKGKPVVEVTLNHEYLFQAAKLLTQFNKGRGVKMVKLSIYQPNEPVIMTSETNEHTAKVVLMPLMV
jgi:DNA polymerase III sliding clamp (beta) subunit (PCNA family)